MPSQLTPMPSRLAAVIAIAAALIATGAAPAAAAPAWDYGLPEEMYEQTCQSIGGGGGLRSRGARHLGARGHARRSAGHPEGRRGLLRRRHDRRGRRLSDKSVIPEVVPPLGVELAVSPANPVRCHYTLPDGSDTPIIAGCPQAPKAGTQGGFSLAPGGDPGNAWVGIGKIPGTPALTRPQLEILYLEFPLRASRPLTGLPGRPECPDARRPVGPCARDAAGDFLQVAVQVFSPAAAPRRSRPRSACRRRVRRAAPPAALGGTGTPALGDAEAPARALHRARLRTDPAAPSAASPSSVAVPADGARVTATLRARRLGRIAVARRSGVEAGRLRLRLKPTRGAARKLRRVRAVVATLRVTVKLPGRPAVVETARIRLRR